MADYGIKVSQPGYDVKTATPSQLSFSSKYQQLKVYSQGSGTLTESGSRMATINHGLGYVPMFIVHNTLDPFYQNLFGIGASDYLISPAVWYRGSVFDDRNCTAYADEDNLYIKMGDDFGWEYFTDQADANNLGNLWKINGGSDSYSNTLLEYGQRDVSGDSHTWDGALRVENVAIAKNESLYKAEVGLPIYNAYGSNSLPMTIYGIDEDNTANFSSSPFGRSNTTASYNHTCDSGLGVNDYWRFGVEDIVSEITSRSNWSSGNAMGFKLYQNSVSEATRATLSTWEALFNEYLEWSHLRILRSNTLASYKYTIFVNEINP